MSELTAHQIKELEEAKVEKEAQLEALKRQFMQELSKRPVRYVRIPVSTLVMPNHRLGPPQVLAAGPVLQQARRPSARKVVVSPAYALHPAGIGA